MRLQLNKFNFDDLKELFEEDFEKGMKERERIIDSFIDELPDEKTKQRVRAYQFRIDMDLRKFKHPVARMERIKGKLYEQMALLVETITNPVEVKKKANVVNIHGK